MHIISTDENQVFAAVQEWNQNDTYNLYISDTRGIYFTLALENIKRSQGVEGNIIIDLYEVCLGQPTPLIIRINTTFQEKCQVIKSIVINQLLFFQ